MRTSNAAGTYTTLSDTADHAAIAAGSGGGEGTLTIICPDTNTGGKWWVGNGPKTPIPAGAGALQYRLGLGDNAVLNVSGNGLVFHATIS